jgi:hypothetical protein
MPKTVDLTVEVRYTVSLTTTVPDEIARGLGEIYDEGVTISDSDRVDDYKANAIEWLLDNVEEKDGHSFEFEILDMSDDDE